MFTQTADGVAISSSVGGAPFAPIGPFTDFGDKVGTAALTNMKALAAGGANLKTGKQFWNCFLNKFVSMVGQQTAGQWISVLQNLWNSTSGPYWIRVAQFFTQLLKLGVANYVIPSLLACK
jgi:hypothetical protein